MSCFEQDLLQIDQEKPALYEGTSWAVVWSKGSWEF